MWQYLVWSIRLRRVEYRIAELPIYLIPVMLVISDTSALVSAPFWEGLVIFLFLMAFGDLLNCLSDRELDAIYKPHLTEAVFGIGIKGVLIQAALSALSALALTIHLAWLLNFWLLIPLMLFGAFVAYAYSIEPFRLKRRGLWQLAFYWFGLFTGPMIFAAMLFQPLPPFSLVMVAVWYGLTQTGVILFNTAEDYPEDLQLGVKTVIVSLGLRTGIGWAVVMVLVGGLGLIASFIATMIERRMPSVTLIALVPLVVAWVTVTCMMAITFLKMRRRNEVEAIQLVKSKGRWVPLWITSIAESSLFMAFICFKWGILTALLRSLDVS